MRDAGVWRATNTHLYPGAWLTADTDEPCAGPVTIEFADLGTVRARLEARGGEWLLRVAAHRTQRGAAIDAKIWRVEPLVASEPGARWRVVGRAAG
jgi:hypothetical protein